MSGTWSTGSYPPGVITQQQGYNPQQGYISPQQQGYISPQQQGYISPQQQGYIPQQGYISQQQQGFSPPDVITQQQDYIPPQQQGRRQQAINYVREHKKDIGLGAFVTVGLIIALLWLVVFRIPGKLSEWSEWSKCDKECGGGTQTRTRTYTPPSGGGSDSPDKDKLKETQACNTQLCKINGKMSDWQDINNNCKQSASDSANEILCGSGFRKQSRSYIPASNGGLELDVNSSDRKLVIRWVSCSKDRCTDVDGTYTSWVNDGNCVKSITDSTRVTCKDSSNPGKQKQKRTYIPKIGNGIEIASGNRLLEQWVTCDTSNMQDCPVRQNGVCSNVQWDNSCTCRNNKYQISSKRNYTPATGGGADISCDTTQTWVDCNSSNSTNSIFSTLSTSIKNLFTPNGLCPANATLENAIVASDTTCTPATGTNRKKLQSRNYTFPIGTGTHATEFNDMFINNHNSGRNILNEFNNMAQNVRTPITANNHINVSKSYFITRTNNTFPQQYKIEEEVGCSNVPLYTETEINNKWKIWTGCTTNFNDIYNNINTNYDELAYSNITVAENKFNPYKLENMLANTTNDYNKRKACYGNDGYLTITNSNKNLYTPGNRLGPGFRFVRGVTDGVVILRSGNYTFSILETGNLYIYGPGGHIHGVYLLNNLQSLTMQHDGNLVIIDTTGAGAYYSNTYDNPGAYLELEDTGELYIKNSNGTIIHYVRSRIRAHLTSAFYDNSPNTVFSDKKGRFFPFKLTNNGNEIQNNILYDNNVKSDNCDGDDEFKGWCIDDTNSIWDVRELNLLNYNYYIENTTGDNNKPNKSDNNGIESDNYNRDYDRTNFFSDGGNRPGSSNNTQIRKPLGIRGGVSKSNYLPGYLRVSYVDGTGGIEYSYKFLVMQRGTHYNNQAFVLYQKFHSRDAFADDIIQNHPEIIEKLKEYYRNN